MQSAPAPAIDATAALDRIRERRAISRRRQYRKSRLARHRAELVALRRAGASYPDLVDWLRRERHTRVAHTTVMRYLKQLPELADA